MWFLKRIKKFFQPSTVNDEMAALALLFAAESLLLERKIYEAFHNGLSIGFEDNPHVLIEIQRFLLKKNAREKLQKLLKK